MGASVAWGCMSVALAFPCAALLGSCAAARSRSFASGDMLARLARNGVSWTLPAAKRLAKTRRVQRSLADAVDLLGERGIFASPVGLLSLAIAAAVAVAAVVGALAQSPVAGVAVVALAIACLLTRVHLWRDRQAEALRDAVPDALHAMGSCFQAGFSPLQTFQHLASELRGPLGKRFADAAHLLETGHDMHEALDALRGAGAQGELVFVSVALDVQHQAGGSMRPVLEAARETVEGELALKRSLRVQTAQARLSARIVTIMPFALVAVFSLVSKGFLDPFFESPLGVALLCMAVLMQVAGVAAVRRMLSIEVS